MISYIIRADYKGERWYLGDRHATRDRNLAREFKDEEDAAKWVRKNRVLTGGWFPWEPIVRIVDVQATGEPDLALVRSP